MNAVVGLGERSAHVQPSDRAAHGWRASVLDRLAESSERVIEEFERTGGDPCQAFIEQEFRAQIQKDVAKASWELKGQVKAFSVDLAQKILGRNL